MAEAPDSFLPVAGGWGLMGATHIRLAKADRDILTGALHAAWKLRVDKNAATRIRRLPKSLPSRLSRNINATNTAADERVSPPRRGPLEGGALVWSVARRAAA